MYMYIRYNLAICVLMILKVSCFKKWTIFVSTCQSFPANGNYVLSEKNIDRFLFLFFIPSTRQASYFIAPTTITCELPIFF